MNKSALSCPTNKFTHEIRIKTIFTRISKSFCSVIFAGFDHQNLLLKFNTKQNDIFIVEIYFMKIGFLKFPARKLLYELKTY